MIAFYHSSNLYKTSREFSLNTKTILRWVKDEQKIGGSKKGSRRAVFQRSALFPDMEERLYGEYKELRRKGLKVKGWWFRVRGKQILMELHPEALFQFSCSWFDGFKTCHRISLRRATNACQKPPDDKMEAIRRFHQSIRRKARTEESSGPLGRWTQRHIANVDQTPLPFTFTDGATYADTGEKTVWVRGGASGLDKRQCTVQLTLFADGETRVKPLVIFRGKGVRITFLEKLQYDRRVAVTFQENAWCDEKVMDGWVCQHWKPSCEGEMLLVADRAQKTEAIIKLLKERCNTEIEFVPPGATSLVQPVDVVFNAPFKAAVDKLATDHLHSNVEAYLRGEINASQRRILLTKWIGQAWEEVSSNKEMVQHSFKKCGIAVAIDGSEDEQINIEAGVYLGGGGGGEFAPP